MTLHKTKTVKVGKTVTVINRSFSVMRGGGYGLITSVTYADGTMGYFEYRGRELIKARIADHFYEKTIDGWPERINNSSRDNFFNGLWPSFDLIQEDTDCFCAGTVVLRSDLQVQVITPFQRYSVGLDTDGRIISVSYPDRSFALLEYDSDGRLAAVRGAVNFITRARMHELLVVEKQESLGEEFSQLDAGDLRNPSYYKDIADVLYVVADISSPHFGSIVAEGTCVNDFVRGVFRPDGTVVEWSGPGSTVAKIVVRNSANNVQHFDVLTGGLAYSSSMDTIVPLPDYSYLLPTNPCDLAFAAAEAGVDEMGGC